MKTHHILLLGLSILCSANFVSARENNAQTDLAAETAETSTFSNSEFFLSSASAGPFGWLKGIKSPKDLLSLIRVGVQTRGEMRFPLSTDTSLQHFEFIKPDSKLNFKLDVGLPVGTLTLAYNFHSTSWNGDIYSGRYFLTHINFYNLHALADIPPFSLMYLPTGTYATGNANNMSYRELDLRVMLGMGFNETAYIFHDNADPYVTSYYARRKISIVGIKGLVEAFADYDIWDLAYGGKETSTLNTMLANSLGSWAKYAPVPYASIYFLDTKVEKRYYDIPVNSDRTGYKFGWDFGLLYTHSFFWDLGPGRLIVQPRADLTLFDTSLNMRTLTVNSEYLPFNMGLRASIDVCYFF